jgi:hypothetical protein
MESGSNPDRPSPLDVARPASMTDAIIPVIALVMLVAPPPAQFEVIP